MDLYPVRPCFSRRRTSRVDTVSVMEGVAIYWRCNSLEDVSRVRDLSFGGMFVKTPTPLPAGALATIDFLVPEGQIRAEAVVRHVQPASGLGLKFTAMPEADRPRLGMLIARLRQSSRIKTAT
jgi:c-di-GMP-binding flagellar brake protein YcgR